MQNRPRAGILIDDVCDWRGPHQESVIVVVQVPIILVPGAQEFRGVSREKEILDVNVAQHHLLMAAVERVELAVGVLLQEIEIRRVVFDAIRLQIPENAHSRLLVYKKKAAKVRVELLDA